MAEACWAWLHQDRRLRWWVSVFCSGLAPRGQVCDSHDGDGYAHGEGGGHPEDEAYGFRRHTGYRDVTFSTDWITTSRNTVSHTRATVTAVFRTTG